MHINDCIRFIWFGSCSYISILLLRIWHWCAKHLHTYWRSLRKRMCEKNAKISRKNHLIAGWCSCSENNDPTDFFISFSPLYSFIHFLPKCENLIKITHSVFSHCFQCTSYACVNWFHLPQQQQKNNTNRHMIWSQIEHRIDYFRIICFYFDCGICGFSFFNEANRKQSESVLGDV